jgi:hypothetical protein
MDMVNGLYSVNFSGPVGAGTGVVAIRDGSLNGGDAGFGYLGTLRVEGARVAASLRIVRHTQTFPGVSIFGPLTDFQLEVSGSVAQGDRFTLSGAVSGQPNQRITVQGHKFAELAH